MKFGVREICDVVLKAKAAQKIGNKVFYKNEPVIYFDSLKTSSMEGAATTVYAQGGRGNARLVAWEGERTVTFTMEDALISPAGFSILTGAGLIDAQDKPVIMHTTERTDNIKLVTADDVTTEVQIALSDCPFLGKNQEPESGSDEIGSYQTFKVNTKEDFIYIMLLDDNGEVKSEPYIASEIKIYDAENSGNKAPMYVVSIHATEESGTSDDVGRVNDLTKFNNNSVVLVDYYVQHESGAFQVDITPDKFGGNFYLEASTLFRDTNGVDMPAEFIIPNCKVQSNFTFTMASSGDPSTFTFTMDAFPDYTRWDKTKKVFAAIQVLNLSDTTVDFERLGTHHNGEDPDTGEVLSSTVQKNYNTNQRPFIEKDNANYGFDFVGANSSGGGEG